MVQRYEQKRRLQWYKRGAAYPDFFEGAKLSLNPCSVIYYDQFPSSMMTGLRDKVKGG